MEDIDVGIHAARQNECEKNEKSVKDRFRFLIAMRMLFVVRAMQKVL